MDTKVIAMVGAVIVVGAAVYGVATGTVLPGTQDIGDNETVDSDDGGDDVSTPVNSNSGNDNDEEEDSGDENDVGDEQENVTSTEQQQEPEQEPLPYVCEQREGDIDPSGIWTRRTSVSGGPFDPIFFESMLHDRVNKLRDRRSDTEPLKCDPKLRELAREHSELVVKDEDEEYGEVEIKDTEVRYEGVCENPVERYGTWYYQRDIELDSPDSGDGDQRVDLIEDHEDLARDVRGVWGSDDSFIEEITDRRMKRQGIGAYIDRESRRVVVTQVLCEERAEDEEDTEGEESG